MLRVEWRFWASPGGNDDGCSDCSGYEGFSADKLPWPGSLVRGGRAEATGCHLVPIAHATVGTGYPCKAFSQDPVEFTQLV